MPLAAAFEQAEEKVEKVEKGSVSPVTLLQSPNHNEQSDRLLEEMRQSVSARADETNVDKRQHDAAVKIQSIHRGKSGRDVASLKVSMKAQHAEKTARKN